MDTQSAHREQFLKEEANVSTDITGSVSLCNMETRFNRSTVIIRLVSLYKARMPDAPYCSP